MRALNLVECDNSDTLMHDILEKSGDQGDVQTCVALIIVLKGRLTVDDSRARLWFQSYIGTHLLLFSDAMSRASPVLSACRI